MTSGIRPRRLLPFLVVFVGAAAPASDGPAAVELTWHDVATLPLEGRGWSDTEHRYDRLPRHAAGRVRDAVWNLSHDAAGLSVRFVTDATKISARWVLRSEPIAMPHMAATGVSGLDLYIRQDGDWRFLAVGRPTRFPENQASLVDGLPEGEKEFRLYFPLYNGVDRVEIGLLEGASFRAAAAPKDQRPVVFYGTSITQGGCASRPGMAYPAILGRRLGRPVINLGFSGNGKSEPELAALLAELDPAAFVLDSLPNLETEQAVERLPAFVATLRSARPETPIVLVENLIYTDSPFVEKRRARQAASNEFLRRLKEDLEARGERNLHLVSAESLIGGDGEATVDGTHPTDLGFLRMADTMEPVLRLALDR